MLVGMVSEKLGVLLALENVQENIIEKELDNFQGKNDREDDRKNWTLVQRKREEKIRGEIKRHDTWAKRGVS